VTDHFGFETSGILFDTCMEAMLLNSGVSVCLISYTNGIFIV